MPKTGDSRTEAVLNERRERTQLLLEEVEDFLTEGLCSAGTLGTWAGLGGHFVSDLRKGRTVKATTVARVQDAMSNARKRERERLSMEIAAIQALPHSAVVIKATGEVDVAPAGLGEMRLRRLIDRGILVASGDSLFPNIPSQTYRIASHVLSSQG